MECRGVAWARVRSTLIHRLAALRIEPRLLTDRYAQEQDVAIRRAYRSLSARIRQRRSPNKVRSRRVFPVLIISTQSDIMSLL